MFYCAGELGGYASSGTLVPQLHFTHLQVHALSERAFIELSDDVEELLADIHSLTTQIQSALQDFVEANHIDLILVENAQAIPMNLPLGVALKQLIEGAGIRTIAHHHDFYWERPRYQRNHILDLLDSAFPSDAPNIRHVTINTIAQRRLKARRDIDSIVIPNVHDFAKPPVRIDDYNRDLRAELSFTEDDFLVLQPTRVVRRKGIEKALMLLKELGIPNTKLLITHGTSDEGEAYWRWLSREAAVMQVDLRLVEDRVDTQRGQANGHKIYSLWDVYPHADLVTYPSDYEGFGNALLETVYYKRLMVVNSYPVYNADIGPLGFDFVELDGFVDEDAIQHLKKLLDSPAKVQEIVTKNYDIALKHFSLEVLEEKLHQVLDTF
ncbi:MAG: glycosyl transferase family 1 [Chloroflexi bacterium]|nr:MAG: glycosyl transferase family 1 [Chloroflexota bacterium]MBL1195461.1 glycosyl transferase family 1 [Chloroflexota bacterium]